MPTRKLIGGTNKANRHIRFSNNTKKSNKSNKSNQNVFVYANSQYSSNPVHEENAHLFAKVAAQRSTPEKMAKDLYYLYYPQELSVKDYTLMIDLVGNSDVSEEQKERIIKSLRYDRAMAKVKTYVD